MENIILPVPDFEAIMASNPFKVGTYIVLKRLRFMIKVVSFGNDPSANWHAGHVDLRYIAMPLPEDSIIKYLGMKFDSIDSDPGPEHWWELGNLVGTISPSPTVNDVKELS